MTYIINFLNDCSFGIDINEQPYTFENRLISNRVLEDRYLPISLDLFHMYKMVSNSEFYFSYKKFHFLSYNEVYNQYREQNILLGRYYEGMGYCCNLYYNQDHKYYFFQIMGGSDGHAVVNNQAIFANSDYSILDKNKRFNNLKCLLEFIEKTAPTYEGEICYFTHPNVIN